MKILIIGDDIRYHEMLRILEDKGHHTERSMGGEDEDYQEFELILDLNFDDDSSNLNYFARLKDRPVMVCSVKQQLAEIVYLFEGKIKCRLIGANFLPTFINRTRWEISLLHPYQRTLISPLLESLSQPADFVEDRVGMVVPRILFMIINEACYTLQEGTADMKDIDLAMKLGTNYPYGPFEWCDRIGITDVFETLAAIYEDTRDERYKICPLLKTAYLKNKPFYKTAKLST